MQRDQRLDDLTGELWLCSIAPGDPRVRDRRSHTLMEKEAVLGLALEWDVGPKSTVHCRPVDTGAVSEGRLGEEGWGLFYHLSVVLQFPAVWRQGGRTGQCAVAMTAHGC